MQLFTVFHCAEQVVDDLEILGFIDRIKTQPQAEPVGQRDFFLHHIAVMQLPVYHLGLLVIFHVFGEQMAAVAGGVNAHVLRRQLQ